MLVAVLALVWYLAGLAAFISDLFLPDAKQAAMPEAQRALYLSTPAWAWAAYALAVLAGSLGSLLLVLLRKLSVPLLQVSLLGVLARMFHTFFVARAASDRFVDSVIVSMLILVVSIYLVILSMQARNKCWTR